MAHTAQVMNVGLLGAGDIAQQYVSGLTSFDNVACVAVADRDHGVAVRRAQQWQLRAMSPAELLADATIDLVINLTPPRAHLETTRDALAAGKHVYLEKPLALDVEDGRQLLELAETSGLGLSCAPDTFLGSALQTARDSLLDGDIGVPLSATAFVGNAGPERWHPAPEAYYGPGAGPLFSLGPYYLTALVRLLGPIAEAVGFRRSPRPTRHDRDEREFEVTTATTYTGALRFEAGAIATIFASYDVQAERMPPIQIFGSKGTMSVPDPNFFDGPVELSSGDGWTELSPRHRTGLGRGAGASELVRAIQTGHDTRSGARLALHVLDAMCALDAGGRALETTP